MTMTLLFSIFNIANAQLGGLKNKLKGTKKNSGPELGLEEQTFLPAVSLGSLLDANGLRLDLDGTFSINTLEIAFLPKEDKKGERVNYSPCTLVPGSFSNKPCSSTRIWTPFCPLDLPQLP